MKRSEATNTFDQGLLMDLNPLVTPNNVVTNCLNGTLITYNGNENVLQNDMGNGRVETAYLPEGYVPLGTAELGGIIYIVSYNPLIDKCQIGCFPSPERNITSDKIQIPKVSIDNSQFQVDGKIINTIVKVKLLSDPNSEDGLFKLNPGDKYTVYSTNSGVTNNKDTLSDVGTGITKVDATPRYVTIHVVSIGDDGKITYLDDSLKWDSPLDYYIKEASDSDSIQRDIDEHRSLVSSAYNIFNSKVSGELALLFELKVIDSFSVTWNANVIDLEEGEYDKEAKINFDLEWTSSHESINPKYVKLTESDKGQLDTDVVSGNICTLPDFTGRKNDGSDNYETIEAGDFRYKSNDKLSNYVWDYELTPAMKFGELSYLAVRGTINFAEIGSGKIDVDEWRYYVQENSFYLNWGLEAYPEKNKKINKVILTFIPFEQVNKSNVIISEDETYQDKYPQYVISGKNSYSGNFQEVINFKETTKISNGEVLKNNLYLVDICAEYGNAAEGNSDWKYRHHYKWLYTTGQWNDKFFDETITDFTKQLSLTDTIKFKSEFEKDDQIYGNQYKTTLTLPENSTSETVEEAAYKAMGASVIAVNYKEADNTFDKTSVNATVKVSVVPTDYQELFSIEIQDKDKFNNSISSKTISHGDIQVESDALSAISEYVKSKFMEKDVDSDLNNTIKNVLLDGINDKIEDNKVIDQFDASIISGSNSDTVKMNVYGSIFSRINADLAIASVEVGQRVRPLLYLTDDCDQLGLTDQTKLKYYFQEFHKDIGSGQPFSFRFERYNYDGGDAIDSKQSNKKSWNPSDRFSRETYWDKTPPYTEWLLPWMQSSNGPFQILYFESRTTGYGNQNMQGKFILWVRTDNGHFVPINSIAAGTSKTSLTKKIILFLLQLYYVETEASPIEKCIVKSINKLRTFNESWDIKIKSSLTVDNMLNTLNLKVPNSKEVVSLQTIISNSKEVGEDVIDITNLTHTDSVLDLGSETFSHVFRVNSDELYIDYEDAKSTSIPALYEICTKEKSIVGKALNANKLYVYDNIGLSGFQPAKEGNSKYICTGGNIDTVPIEGTTETKVILKNPTGQSAPTKLLNMLSVKDGELYASEDSLLSKKTNFVYHTQEGATYKSNSTVTFIS